MLELQYGFRTPCTSSAPYRSAILLILHGLMVLVRRSRPSNRMSFEPSINRRHISAMLSTACVLKTFALLRSLFKTTLTWVGASTLPVTTLRIERGPGWQGEHEAK